MTTLSSLGARYSARAQDYAWDLARGNIKVKKLGSVSVLK
jgi:hypothetical protein